MNAISGPLKGDGVVPVPFFRTTARRQPKVRTRRKTRDDRLRDRLTAAISGLVDLLDALEGDPDLEDENEHGGDVQDEPHGDPYEDDEEDGSSEPWLGSLDDRINQIGLYGQSGTGGDLEQDAGAEGELENAS